MIYLNRSSMIRDEAIGVFDSGVGGLTVVKELQRQLPQEKIIYLGDAARAPYGPREPEEVLKFSFQLTNFLKQKKIKMLVIACNTATAIALEEIKASIEIPVLGVISPGVRAAIKTTKNKRIGIIGTKATIESSEYQRKIKEKLPDAEIFPLACPKFAPLVESNRVSDDLTKKIVFETLQSFAETKIDTLILGCTHYPLLKPIITAVLGETVQLIDSGVEAISDLSFLLEYFNLQTTKIGQTNDHQFFTTGSVKMFAEVAEKWLEVNQVKIKKVGLDELKAEKTTKVESNIDSEIVIATRNNGKAREFAQLFEPLGFQIKTLADFPEAPIIEETGMTFEENARLKAETIAKLFNRPVLADDSGLMVDALGGMPGVFSARFAGDSATDFENNVKLLHELSSIANFPERRTAQFHCTLVLAAPKMESLVVEADWAGSIAVIPRGENGFGYDPLFIVAGLNKTSAELSPEEKNRISHRALALKKLEQEFPHWWKKLQEQAIKMT